MISFSICRIDTVKFEYHLNWHPKLNAKNYFKSIKTIVCLYVYYANCQIYIAGRVCFAYIPEGTIWAGRVIPYITMEYVVAPRQMGAIAV